MKIYLCTSVRVSILKQHAQIVLLQVRPPRTGLGLEPIYPIMAYLKSIENAIKSLLSDTTQSGM